MSDNAFPQDEEANKPKPNNEWIGRIESAGREEQSWRTRSTSYWRRYLNRYGISSGAVGSFDWSRARSNIFFSNVDFFSSAFLPEMPEPVIRERFSKQQADDEEQKQFFTVCADIVERAIEYCVKTLENKKAVDNFKVDTLITGRGVLWLIFNADDDGQGGLKGEHLELIHLSYNDFRISPARNWKEVWWIARRILLDKDGLKQRFGEEIANKTSFTYPTSEDGQWKGDNTVQYESRAEIWEVWNKKNKKVIFVSPGYPDVLEEIDAPYALQNFFPTPEPLRLISDPNSMIPNPEFDLYQKEAQDLSNAAQRKADLLDHIRARCFVPTTFVKDVSKINSESDGSYIPIDTNSEILNGNGASNIFIYEPIEERAAVMEKLSTEMDSLTQTIYDITGRSDAMTEGGVSPDEGGQEETATRTKMKGKFGSLRLKKKQGLFNDYINQIYKICSEMICEMFSEQTLQEITSVSLPTEEEKQQYQMQEQQKQMQPPQEGQPEEPVDLKYQTYIKKPTWQQVREYLKNTRLQDYLLEVETEMNVWEADAETQQARVNLFDTFTEKIGTILPITQEHPEFSGILMSLLGVVLDSFKMPASQRNGIEDAMQAVEDDLKQSAAEAAQNPAPNPELIAAEAEKTKADAEQMAAQTKQMLAQQEAQRAEQELGLKQREIEAKIEIEQSESEIKREEIQMKQYQTGIDKQIQEMKLEIEKLKIEALREKEQGKLAIERENYTDKSDVARTKIQAHTQDEQMKLSTKERIEQEKIALKAQTERAKIVEKAAEADQEYEGGGDVSDDLEL